MGACQIHSPCGMQMQQEHWLWCWWQCIPIILVLCRGGGLFLLLGRHGDRMPHAPGSNLFPDSRYECGAKWHTKSQPGGVQERVLKGDWWNYNSTWRQDYKAEFQFQPLRSQSGISQKPGLCMDWFVIVAEPFVLGSKPSKPCCGVWNRPFPSPGLGCSCSRACQGWCLSTGLGRTLTLPLELLELHPHTGEAPENQLSSQKPLLEHCGIMCSFWNSPGFTKHSLDVLLPLILTLFLLFIFFSPQRQCNFQSVRETFIAPACQSQLRSHWNSYIGVPKARDPWNHYFILTTDTPDLQRAEAIPYFCCSIWNFLLI